MNHFMGGISIVTGVMLGVGQSSAIAAQIKSDPVPAPFPAATPGAATGVAGIDNEGFPARRHGLADVCVFATKGDDVHISSAAFEASVHGWWINGDCPTTTAVVTVRLQEYYSDGRWRNQGTVGRGTVRSGGGAGNRATGRAGCNSTSPAGWRSVIDVDLVGVTDDARTLPTPGRNIGCTRW